MTSWAVHSYTMASGNGVSLRTRYSAQMLKTRNGRRQRRRLAGLMGQNHLPPLIRTLTDGYRVPRGPVELEAYERAICRRKLNESARLITGTIGPHAELDPEDEWAQLVLPQFNGIKAAPDMLVEFRRGPRCPRRPLRRLACADAVVPHTTAAEWAPIQPLLPVPACQTSTGRPSAAEDGRDSPCRRCRVQVAGPPRDFPPWSAVYKFFARWLARDVAVLRNRLRSKIYTTLGRKPQVVAVIIDPQSVKLQRLSAEAVAATTRRERSTVASAISWSTPAAYPCWSYSLTPT